MSTKNTRSGGKYTGSHTTIVPAAAIVADMAHGFSEVTKISLGFIKAGLPGAKGQRRVKLIDRKGSILCRIRDNTTHQEITVYSTDIQKTRTEIVRLVLNGGFHVSFGET